MEKAYFNLMYKEYTHITVENGSIYRQKNAHRYITKKWERKKNGTNTKQMKLTHENE